MEREMKKSACITILIVLVAITGCERQTRLAGTWRGEENSTPYVLVLREDGTGGLGIGDLRFGLKYEANGTAITMKVAGENEVTSLYHIDFGGKLTIKNMLETGIDVAFKKSVEQSK
jgi:hypothetical protein